MGMLRKLRRSLYKGARILGDVNAVTSGNPARMAKRMMNKFTGRKLARHLFFR